MAQVPQTSVADVMHHLAVNCLCVQSLHGADSLKKNYYVPPAKLLHVHTWYMIPKRCFAFVCLNEFQLPIDMLCLLVFGSGLL